MKSRRLVPLPVHILPVLLIDRANGASCRSHGTALCTRTGSRKPGTFQNLLYFGSPVRCVLRSPLQGADDLRKGFASVHPGKDVLSRLPEADPAQKLFGGVLFLLPLVIAFGVICGRIRKNSSDI